MLRAASPPLRHSLIYEHQRRQPVSSPDIDVCRSSYSMGGSSVAMICFKISSMFDSSQYQRAQQAHSAHSRASRTLFALYPHGDQLDGERFRPPPPVLPAWKTRHQLAALGRPRHRTEVLWPQELLRGFRPPHTCRAWHQGRAGARDTSTGPTRQHSTAVSHRKLTFADQRCETSWLNCGRVQNPRNRRRRTAVY